ncbi:MAG: DNA mismatch repair protein MutS [Pseudomonadota bacterium]
MMAQYHEIKAQHPDALLFYRMGDFYEMFFDDAIAAAEALDIALTKRGKHEGGDIPMCGVPVHAAEGYFLTLIRKGFRVAVCEQMESPAEAKKRGYKAVVKREVVRLVTPGTLTEDSLLEARRNNHLASYAQVRGDHALAWTDISTGTFFVMPVSAARLSPELARLMPSELIVSESVETQFDQLGSDFGIAITGLARSAFDSAGATKKLCQLFKVASLDAFGSFSRTEVSAMGALLDYIELTQKGKLPLLRPPQKEVQGGTVQIDAATRRNLELTQSLTGGRDGTLLSVMDRTQTAGGARLLARRISSPCSTLETIQARLDAVSFGFDLPRVLQEARYVLRSVPDLDRALSRLSLDRGGPRDLAAIRNGLTEAGRLSALLTEHELPMLFAQVVEALQGHDSLIDRLDAALVAEPPLIARDGGFIAQGYHEELDEVRRLRDEGRSIIAQMQQEYVALADISSLKIKHNYVLGYFVETTATHAERMMAPPLSETFIHRQTTANQVRFTTVALSELETKILNAGSRALDIEKMLFDSLRAAVMERAGEVGQAAMSLAEIDVGLSLADLAARQDWVRPTVDSSRDFKIRGGRHPVVEEALAKQSGDPFIANDCDLDPQPDAAKIWLLTGPNMAGKSTFLRQNALIALMAQMGSFVPAEEARIGIISQLFSRVGASDDLARGRSTFMVEMVETAAILNQADARALVILDEIGRGTSTYDGLSIAWATLEHLHDVNRARALFATHYHEMTALAEKLSGVENATVAVKEWQGEVVFLHEVRKGAADRSYGVQVAQLAGLPKAVIERARIVLQALEKGEREGGRNQKALIDDLPLFSVAASSLPPQQKSSAVEDALAEISPDELSPREALDLLYQLKETARASKD